MKTLNGFKEFKFKEKGSVFIAQAYPVESVDEVAEILKKIKKKYYDATHHCFAYKLFSGEIKYSDDGEPNGSAGIRILNAIEHFGLENVLVIVIRYFGGTKLGVGPLGKAYYQAAAGSLKEADITEKELYIKIKIQYDYEMTNKIHHLISKYHAKNIVNGFAGKPFIEFFVTAGSVDALVREAIEITGGKIKTEVNNSPVLI